MFLLKPLASPPVTPQKAQSPNESGLFAIAQPTLIDAKLGDLCEKCLPLLQSPLWESPQSAEEITIHFSKLQTALVNTAAAKMAHFIGEESYRTNKAVTVALICQAFLKLDNAELRIDEKSTIDKGNKSSTDYYDVIPESAIDSVYEDTGTPDDLYSDGSRTRYVDRKSGAMISDDELARIDTSELPHPWDRQAEESPAEFLAFCYYRDLGPNRTIADAFRLSRKDGRRASGSYYNLSGKNGWESRVIAFDKHTHTLGVEHQRRLDALESTQLEQNKRERRDSLLNLGQQFGQKAVEILSIPIAKDSYIEQKDGKTIIHRAMLLSPAHLFAAAACAKAFRELTGDALYPKTGEDESESIETWQRQFYKTTGAMAKDLPRNAMPEPPDDPSEKPTIAPPANMPGKDATSGRGDAAIPAGKGTAVIIYVLLILSIIFACLAFYLVGYQKGHEEGRRLAAAG